MEKLFLFPICCLSLRLFARAIKLRNRDNIFAKDFNMTPIVISTTKEQYKAATKKALENYADMFVAKIKFSKKS